MQMYTHFFYSCTEPNDGHIGRNMQLICKTNKLCLDDFIVLKIFVPVGNRTKFFLCQVSTVNIMVTELST